MKELYHGSIYDFDRIDLNAGKGYKDFGRGFYATAIPVHAERPAIRNKAIAIRRQMILKRRQDIDFEPIKAYRYNLIFNENFDKLKVKFFKGADTEWLRFIIDNRKCSDSAHDYDIVIGPTADAETVTLINEYADELIESGYSDMICKRLIAELKPENLPNQYFFRTAEAIGTLRFASDRRRVVG